MQYVLVFVFYFVLDFTRSTFNNVKTAVGDQAHLLEALVFLPDI